MKIGTLSFELRGSEMALHGKDRIERIVTAINDHSPDILVTGGYSLQEESDLNTLGRALKKLNWDGLLFVEVKDSESHSLSKLAKKGNSNHCAFAWISSRWERLGVQHLMDSRDRDDRNKLADFQANLERRKLIFRRKNVGLLICGELNVVKGRNNVEIENRDIEEWFRSLDIIVNPTHDRMSNHGTLIAKRKYLSTPAGSKSKTYVSASNWNSLKRISGRTIAQSPDADTLHTVYLNGARLKQISGGYEDFEYREASA